jgi:hypothetical protein
MSPYARHRWRRSTSRIQDSRAASAGDTVFEVPYSVSTPLVTCDGIQVPFNLSESFILIPGSGRHHSVARPCLHGTCLRMVKMKSDARVEFVESTRKKTKMWWVGFVLMHATQFANREEEKGAPNLGIIVHRTPLSCEGQLLAVSKRNTTVERLMKVSVRIATRIIYGIQLDCHTTHNMWSLHGVESTPG